ncbi:MAG: hypothetical protein OES79_10525 [Planctomycetota bacterium]|nr:hypothetical protein [Planctomycetota bacterium]
MDNLSEREFRNLLSLETQPCTSIYLPTNPAGEDSQQDRLRLKNFLQAAEQQLVQQDHRAAEVRQWLQPARDLLTDQPFWTARSHGLAVFISPQQSRFYRLPHRFDESLTVGDRAYIKPLLPLYIGNGDFYILAISQNKVRFLKARRDEFEELALAALPKDIEEALNYDGPQEVAQAHTASAGRGKQAAVFHGQGGRPDASKEELQQYCRLIDVAVQAILRDQPGPLVLAGVDYVLSIYRSGSSYDRIVEQSVSGNTDHLAAHELHARAWPVAQPALHQPRDEAVRRYQRAAGSDKASDDLQSVVTAAHQGRVDSLLLVGDAQQWGRVQAPQGTVDVHADKQPGDEDLVDRAAVDTLRNRGTVFVVSADQLPAGAPLAALLRY